MHTRLSAEVPQSRAEYYFKLCIIIVCTLCIAFAPIITAFWPRVSSFLPNPWDKSDCRGLLCGLSCASRSRRVHSLGLSYPDKDVLANLVFRPHIHLRQPAGAPSRSLATARAWAASGALNEALAATFKAWD